MIREFDEWLDIIFFIEGTYKIGYSLNGK